MTQQFLPFRPARPNKIIEAGAGTGKTTAIVREALELLLENPELKPERLVMITFTEKAAAEIGERIRDAITTLHATGELPPHILEIPPAKVNRYRAATARHLPNLDKVRSHTIHAFCQSLLRLFPLQARVDPSFRVVEGYDRARLLNESYSAWLEDETVTHPNEEFLDDWEKVLEHFAGVDRLQAAVLELLEKRALVTDDAYTLGDFADAEEAVRKAIEDAGALSPDAIDAMTDIPARTALRHLHDQPPPLSNSLEEWREFFEPIADALNRINFHNVPRQLREPLRTIRKEGNRPCVYDAIVCHTAAVALRRLARRFITFLDREKERRGVLDFDDLLVRTAEILSDAGTADVVRQRFDHIFVDEFQDTDRVQAKIVEILSKNRAGEFVHGRTVLVGDPKQSIYAFRQADPETYRATVSRFLASGAEIRTLKKQYRSEPDLVQALNAMFTRLFATEPDPHVYRPPYHQLEPGLAATGKGPHLLFLRADAVSEVDDEVAAAEHEGCAIASFIRDEVANGRQYSDFAILLRKLANVQAFLDGLDQCGIPYVVPPAGALLETRPVVDLLAVLRSIAAPFDMAACISAARTPYFALDDNEIVNGLLNRESAEWSRFRETLRQYQDVARNGTVAELINRLIADAQLELVYGLSRGGEEWLRFIERFREIAVQFDLSRGGSVAQFVDEQLRRRERSEETQPAPIDDGRNAVRILTVHGSKGLEFPVVILPELAAATRQDTLSIFAIEEPRRVVFTGEVTTLAACFRGFADVVRDRRSAEKDRLFYVGVTRARERVVFVTSPQRWVKQEFFKRVANTFGLEKGWNPWGTEPGVVEGTLQAGERAVPAAFVTPQPLVEPISISRFISQEIDRLAVRPASPVPRPASIPETDEGRGTWDEGLFAVRPASPVPRPASIPETDEGRGTWDEGLFMKAAATKNRAAGILLHRILELWDGDAEKLEPLFRDLAREQAADARTIDLTRRRFDMLRKSPSLSRIVSGPTHGRELTIYYLDSDGSAVEARVDRLIEENGQLVVVDYKSGDPRGPRVEADRDQVQRYCAAVSRMTSRPCSGLLWYVDADSDQLIAVSTVGDA